MFRAQVATGTWPVAAAAHGTLCLEASVFALFPVQKQDTLKSSFTHLSTRTAAYTDKTSLIDFRQST